MSFSNYTFIELEGDDIREPALARLAHSLKNLGIHWRKIPAIELHWQELIQTK